MSYKMTPTERDLSDAGYAIGALMETNPHWLAGLAALVEDAGTPVNELTVGQLRTLIVRRDKAYSRTYAAIEEGISC